MNIEQTELMKVIEFPKNKIEEKENRDRLNKLEVAYKMLETLVKEGHDFHIVISADATERMFKPGKISNNYYGVLTSNLDKAEKIRIKSDNTAFYPIRGDEF